MTGGVSPESTGHGTDGRPGSVTAVVLGRSLTLTAGLLALVWAGSWTAIRLVRNVPFDPLSVPSVLEGGVTATLPLVVCGALVALAVSTGRPSLRVGTLVAGVFGLLGTLAGAAVLPATIALVLGGGLLAVASLSTVRTRVPARLVVALLLVGGVTTALGATTGLLPGDVRVIGAYCTVGAAAVLGVAARRDHRALIAGGLGALSVVGMALAAPFVTGSILLTGFGIVGVPVGLTALGAGGLVAAGITGFRSGRLSLALGASLLLVAGVPATIPRAMVVVLACALVCGEWSDAMIGGDPA